MVSCPHHQARHHPAYKIATKNEITKIYTCSFSRGNDIDRV